MNTLKYIILSAVMVLVNTGIRAQENKFEHKLLAGFNIGATAPIPIPRQVRSVDGWWPQFTPQLGYNIVYNHTNRWGLGSGILFGFKGMGARDKVKYMFTSVVLSSENDRPLQGYFTGRNETKVRSSYLTVPLYVNFKAIENWSFRLGGYGSYRFSSDFKGTVWDGYLRVVDEKGDPLDGEKIRIDSKNDATFDFGDDMRKFDFGLLGGAERRINDRFGVFGNLNWGLTSIFPSGFKTISFDMYNIYFTVGLTYKL